MMHFCTIINAPFVIQGLALYRSLQRHCSSFRLWVLCSDRESFELLKQMECETLSVISLSDIESTFSELFPLKQERSSYEYIATLKPYLVRYLLEKEHDIETLTSLDADLFFFSDPTCLLDELGENSVLLTPHHFSPHLTHLAKHGKFNGGFVMFRNDEEGTKAAVSWSEKVFEWCSDKVEGERRSNQKYLEELSKSFKRVRNAQHPGLNAAPWNIDSYKWSRLNGQIMLDGKPLVFYHFHHLHFLTSWLLDPSLALYRTRAHRILKRQVYAPYLRELHAIQKELRSNYHFHASIGSVRYSKEQMRFDILLMLSRLRRSQWFLVWRGRIL